MNPEKNIVHEIILMETGGTCAYIVGEWVHECMRAWEGAHELGMRGVRARGADIVNMHAGAVLYDIQERRCII
jgi:hypothetical protein